MQVRVWVKLWVRERVDWVFIRCVAPEHPKAYHQHHTLRLVGGRNTDQDGSLYTRSLSFKQMGALKDLGPLPLLHPQHPMRRHRRPPGLHGHKVAMRARLEVHNMATALLPARPRTPPTLLFRMPRICRRGSPTRRHGLSAQAVAHWEDHTRTRTECFGQTERRRGRGRGRGGGGRVHKEYTGAAGAIYFPPRD